MNKSKETFSTIGAIFFIISRFIVPILPFIMIGGNFFFMFAMIFICYMFPIVSPIFWIWGLVCAVKGVQDIFAILFYIAFVLIWIPFFIRVLLGLFKKN